MNFELVRVDLSLNRIDTLSNISERCTTSSPTLSRKIDENTMLSGRRNPKARNEKVKN